MIINKNNNVIVKLLFMYNKIININFVTVLFHNKIINYYLRKIMLLFYYLLLLFSHLADAFIQSDLQMRTTEAINWSIKTTKNRSKTKS